MDTRLTCAALLLACCAAPAFATDHPVNPGQNIQLAIDGCQNGDRVLVQPGTYFGKIDFNGKDIEVIGVGGATVTTIDSNGLTGSTVRAAHQEPPTSRLVGFTITGGKNSGVYVSEAYQPNPFSFTQPSNTTIERCIIRNNSSASGVGGGAHLSATARMLTCVVEENFAAAGGGVWGGQLEDVVIRNNTSFSSGGGVEAPKSMKRCRVYDNIAFEGGGVVLEAGGAIEDCSIHHNSSQRGSGVLVDMFGVTASASIVRTRIESNTASVMGAGIDALITAASQPFSMSVVTLYLEANIIRANDSATGAAADIHVVLSGGANQSSNIVLTRCVVDGDALDVAGVSGLSTAEVTGCIFVNQPNPGAAGLGASYSLLPNPGLGIGCFNANPQFVDPASGDVHLMPASPCIDKFLPMPLSQFDFDGDLGAGSAGDVGADERAAHLYIHGDPTPGGAFALKTAGTPGDQVLLFFSATLAPVPVPTAYGPFGLGLPILFGVPLALGPIQANGVVELNAALPLFTPVFTTIDAQAIALPPAGGGQFTNTVSIVVL